MENEIYYTGALMHVPDQRDYKIEEIGFSTAPFDWETGYDIEAEIGMTLKTKDQGQSGSCGGQAWSYYGGVLHLVYKKDGVYDEKSSKFIYAQTFVPGGGSDGRTNSDLVSKQGWGNELDTTSYMEGNPPTEAFMEQVQDITDVARSNALKDLALSYGNVSLNIDSIAQAARDNHGIVIGIAGTNNGTWLSEFPQHPVEGDGATRWYHWLYVGKAKLINGKKFVAIKNSWGDRVGVQGWQWIPEEYFTSNNVFVSWALVYKAQQDITHYVLNNPLHYGMSNPDVAILQHELQSLGFFPTTVNCTGYFGNITATAVKAFQLSKGILDFQNETDMTKIIAGKKTITALNAIFDK